METTQTIPAASIADAFDRILKQLTVDFAEHEHLAVIGIANGGIDLARCLARKLSESLGRSVPCGIANIAFQRDDIGQKPIPKIAAPTEFPFSMNRATVLLVDDVLFTGRTVRAALNEIFDQGRPAQVKLITLFDRGNRRLPVHADYTGFQQATDPQAKVQVRFDCDAPENSEILIFNPATHPST